MTHNNNVLTISSGSSLNLLFLRSMKKYIYENNKDKRIFFENFNYLFGTSGGSIIIFSFLLGYDIDAVYNFYLKITRKFSKSFFRIKTIFNMIKYGSIYKNKIFIECLQEHIENSPLNNRFKNKEFKNVTDVNNLNSDNFTLDLINKIYPEKKVYMITYNLNKKKPIIFTNSTSFKNNSYFNESMDLKELKLMDIVIMSCAAPLIFQKIEKFGNIYVDGALSGLSNPAYISYLITKIETDVKLKYLFFNLKFDYDIKNYDFIQFCSDHFNLTHLFISLTESLKEEDYQEIIINIDSKMSGFNDIENKLNNIKIKNELMDKFKLFFENLS